MTRWAPVQGGPPSRIPWTMAEEAHKVYLSRYGAVQSLERLCERGGFSVAELDDYIPGWRHRADTPSPADVVTLVDAFIEEDVQAWYDEGATPTEWDRQRLRARLNVIVSAARADIDVARLARAICKTRHVHRTSDPKPCGKARVDADIYAAAYREADR